MKDSTNIIATRQVEKVLELLQDSDKTELEPISKYESYCMIHTGVDVLK